MLFFKLPSCAKCVEDVSFQRIARSLLAILVFGLVFGCQKHPKSESPEPIFLADLSDFQANVGEAVAVAGIHSISDGASGVFELLPLDGNTIDSWMVVKSSVHEGHAWFREVDRGFVDPRWFGAKMDGVTDDTPAFLALAEFVATSKSWREGSGIPATRIKLDGVTRLTSDITFKKGVQLLDGEFFLDNASILITGKGRWAIKRCSFRAIGRKTKKPLFFTRRGFMWSIEDSIFDGRGNDVIGAWIGSDGSVWGGYCVGSRFVNCGVGFILGSRLENTHNRIQSSTFDRNSKAGLILMNPSGLEFSANSVEWNTGKYGMILMGNGFGSPNNATGISITSNYIYQNGFKNSEAYASIYAAGFTKENPFIVGGTPFWGRGIYHGISIENNYIISDTVRYGIYLNLFESASIRQNMLKSNGELGVDIKLTGSSKQVTLKGNRNIHKGESSIER